jgi:predicted nucleic acid-binding protein
LIVVDATVPLHAYQRRSELHEPCRAWVGAAFSGEESVCLPWVTVLAFMISTDRRVFEQPLLPATLTLGARVAAYDARHLGRLEAGA